jgi:hypothetical protein
MIVNNPHIFLAAHHAIAVGPYDPCGPSTPGIPARLAINAIAEATTRNSERSRDLQAQLVTLAGLICEDA